MGVGLAQSVEGLKRKNLMSSEEEEILLPDCLWLKLPRRHFPGPLACWPALWIAGLPVLTINWANSLKQTYLSLSIHILLFLFLWRTWTNLPGKEHKFWEHICVWCWFEDLFLGDSFVSPYLQPWKEAHITGVSLGLGVRLKGSNYAPGVSTSFFWILHRRASRLHLCSFVYI